MVEGIAIDSVKIDEHRRSYSIVVFPQKLKLTGTKDQKGVGDLLSMGEFISLNINSLPICGGSNII